MLRTMVCLFFVGCMLSASSCERASNNRSGTLANNTVSPGLAKDIVPQPLVTVTFTWRAFTTPDQAQSRSVSVSGPLFRTPPTAWIVAETIVIDGKEYLGMVISDPKGRKYVLTEVFVYGERDRVLIRAKSKIPFEIVSDDPIGLDLTWMVSGNRTKGPLILEPGQYEIEVVATDDVSLNENPRVSPSKPGEDK